MYESLGTCVQKVEEKDKNLAASARDRISRSLSRTRTSSRQNSKKKAPERDLQPSGGKAQSQPPGGLEFVLPSSAESSSTKQRQKVKKMDSCICQGRRLKHYGDAKNPGVNSRRDRVNHTVGCVLLTTSAAAPDPRRGEAGIAGSRSRPSAGRRS